jgi:hypothetical protein
MSKIVYADENRLQFNDLSDIERKVEHSYTGHPNVYQIFGIKHSVRRALPYGKWTCENGREVIFNREYQPILQRRDGVLSYADRGEWVEDIVKAEMYYDDGCDPADYLTSRYGYGPTAGDKARHRDCKKSLLICLKVLKEFTPEERGSTNRQWSVL